MTEEKEPAVEGLPEFLTVAEVANWLRCDRKVIYRLFEEDKLPGGVRLGRIIRFSKPVLVRFFEGAAI